MSARSHPNVVFIVGDNVGWGDIGCYGGLAPTPRIDALADEGVPFKNYTESTSGPIRKPQWPLIFELINDPVEEWDLIEQRLDCAWVLAPVAQRLGALAQSAARYPHIKAR